MEINTPIAEDIQATDQNAQYDAACKRLLSERIILAWIMKSCLKEYQDCEENLVGDVKEPVRHYDLIDVVILCLGGGEDSDGIFKLLGTLLSSKATVAEK